jgi:hypothetical protein
MKEALSSSETSVLKRAKWRNISEDAILHNSIRFMRKFRKYYSLLAVICHLMCYPHIITILAFHSAVFPNLLLPFTTWIVRLRNSVVFYYNHGPLPNFNSGLLFLICTPVFFSLNFCTIFNNICNSWYLYPQKSLNIFFSLSYFSFFISAQSQLVFFPYSNVGRITNKFSSGPKAACDLSRLSRSHRSANISSNYCG